jgi:uncharacterized membrane protein (UPF0127 family)
MKPSKQIFRLAIASMLLATSFMLQAASPLLQLSVGSGTLEVEVAATKTQRAQGLMHRTVMPDSRGMLFVYPEPAYFCMWMKNTRIPLSVAFIDAQGQVINVADMTPHSETNHCPHRNAMYALEANLGWFAKHGVAAGTQVLGLEKSPRGDY